jgi:hypothetical protein
MQIISDTTDPFRIRGSVIDAMVVKPHKYYDVITFRIADKDVGRHGAPDDYQTASTKLAQLRAWMSTPTTLTVGAYVSELDGLKVLLRDGPIVLREYKPKESIEGYIYQITMLEI